MHAVHTELQGLDLNLVLALHALLAERHVTRAAKRLGLTQSATSHALARLRDTLRDPLLVRAGRTMLLSPRAEAMRRPLDELLSNLASLMSAPIPFDPRSSRAQFTIATSDYVELVVLPKLLARIWAEGPGIDVRVVPAPRDYAAPLSAGTADLAIGLRHLATSSNSVPHGLLMKNLFRERFVCVLRKRRKLDLDTFVKLPHALVTPAGDGGSVVDEALEKLGLQRRVAVRIPHFLVAPHVVAHTDVVLTLAKRVAQLLAPRLKLHVVPPPLELPSFTMSMIWHERHRADPAHTWLRAKVAEVAKQL